MNNMRTLMTLIESIVNIPVLYHGTCSSSAVSLCENGWTPKSGSIGGNAGQNRYLYLSTDLEDALWFAEEKGCNSVVELHNVPIQYLIVDPEDGSSDTVEEEINLPYGLPGKLALTKSLSAEHFKINRP